jgi:hypothetical protein
MGGFCFLYTQDVFLSDVNPCGIFSSQKVSCPEDWPWAGPSVHLQGEKTRGSFSFFELPVKVMNKKQPGRPLMVRGKRDQKIDVRFTRDEYELILKLERTLGISKADLIRNRILRGSEQVVVNAEQLIGALDLLGTEMGRTGNNINQLAKYANALNRQGILSVVVVERYNILLANYQQLQKRLEVLLRRVIRLIGK